MRLKIGIICGIVDILLVSLIISPVNAGQEITKDHGIDSRPGSLKECTFHIINSDAKTLLPKLFPVCTDIEQHASSLAGQESICTDIRCKYLKENDPEMDMIIRQYFRGWPPY